MPRQMCQYPNSFFWSLFDITAQKCSQIRKYLLRFMLVLNEKSNQKNLKDSKSLKIRIFQGVRAQTYWRISSPTTQKKTIFRLFERVRILTHLPNKIHRAKIFARCILLGRCVNIRTRSKSLKIVFFCVVGLDIRQYVCALTPWKILIFRLFESFRFFWLDFSFSTSIKRSKYFRICEHFCAVMSKRLQKNEFGYWHICLGITDSNTCAQCLLNFRSAVLSGFARRQPCFTLQ